MSAVTMVMVADLSDPGHPGLNMGIRFTVIALAKLLGPVLLGFLVEGGKSKGPEMIKRRNLAVRQNSVPMDSL